MFGPHLVKVCCKTKSSDEGHNSGHIWSKSAAWQSPPTRGTFWAKFGQSQLCDKVLRWGAHFGPHLVEVRCVTKSSNVGHISGHIWSKSAAWQSPPTVGTLENGYVRNVPLPRIPRIQSTSQVADATNWYMRVDTYEFVCNQSIIQICFYDLVSPRVSSHPPPNKTGTSALTSRESHITCYSRITWIPTWRELSCSPEGFGTIPIVPFSPLVG